MASYKLYAVALALVCIALQQGVGCARAKKRAAKAEPEIVDDGAVQTTDAENVATDELYRDCDEYNFKIWNETFDDQNAMTLARLSLDTIKEMSADDVCSDTMRHVMKTAETLLTSEYAQYSIQMFFKLIWSIGKKMDMDSDKYMETNKAIKSVITDKRAQDLISNFITRGVNMLKNPVIRDRMVNMADSLAFMFKPYLDKELAKNRANQKKRTTSFNK